MSRIEPVPTVILAGGASRRMGIDKAMLTFGNTTLLRHAAERICAQTQPVVISRHSAGAVACDGIPVIADEGPDHHGPLAGILAGLRHFRKHPATHMATIAVDTPFFPLDLIRRLQGSAPLIDEIIVARSHGRAHPVFALWPIARAEDIAGQLDAGKRKLMGFIEHSPHRFVDFEGDPFFNINTPDDLKAARHRLSAR